MIRSAALSGAIIFIAILASLFGGLALGGALTTGQAEPSFWAGAQAAVMLALGAIVRWVPGWRASFGGRISLFCGGGGSLCAIALFCGGSASNLALMSMLILLGITLLAVFTARLLPSLSGFGCLLLLMIAVILANRGVEKPVAAKASSKPNLTILTALPLFGTTGELMERRAPVIDYLDTSFTIRPLDSFSAAPPPPGGRLLVAQPRALPPADLAAIDHWVRAGGRAVILADPLLVWPTDLPPGDRRRPPITSLLDPLLFHWGLRLLPAQGPAVERRFLSSGALLPLAGAAAFRTNGQCVLAERGLFALCRIGKGSVRLVADADLLDDRLWLADPARASSVDAFTGDTMPLLSAWLADPVSSRPIPAARPWIRDDAAMILVMRWALLAGIGWAMLGAGLALVREKSGAYGK
jgi:hypothetical protein